MNKAHEIAVAVRAAFDHIKPDLVAAVMSDVKATLPTEDALLGALRGDLKAIKDQQGEDTRRAQEAAQRAAEDAERRLAALVREWVEDRGEKREDRAREAIEAAVVRHVSEEVRRIPAPRDGRDGRDGESVFWRGEFRAGRGYGQFDVVKADGSAWIARRATEERPGDGEDWGLLVDKGDKGDRGNSVTGAEVKDGRLIVKTDDFEQDAGDVRGPQGPRGVKGDLGPGFRYRGDWSKSKSYRKQDVVARHGATWVAAIEMKGSEPGSDPRWRVFTPPGQRGKRGEKGAAGRGIASIVGGVGKAVVTFTDGETQTVTVEGVPVWTGPFNALREYTRGDVVSAGSAVWIFVSDTPASASAPSTANADWDVMIRAPQPVQATGGGNPAVARVTPAPGLPEMTLDRADVSASTAEAPYQITDGFTRVYPAALGSSLRLPDDKDGLFLVVSSGVDTDLAVYPTPGGQINFAGVDVPLTIGAYGTARIACIDAANGHWITW
ncbi:hypothetical protein LCM08_06205 [Salipiger pacificus]|nr:hypothetical protein [Alloyangia pacifica]